MPPRDPSSAGRLLIHRINNNNTNNNNNNTGSRFQPLCGDPDNPHLEGPNAIAQARTPQARPSGPAREKNFHCRFFA